MKKQQRRWYQPMEKQCFIALAATSVLLKLLPDKNPMREKILRSFYIKAVKRIRNVDKNHIIFLEGNTWSQVLEHIGEPFADNLSYSVHFYHPLEFTFNFHKNLRYPGDILGEYWDMDTVKKRLEGYYNYSRNRPLAADSNLRESLTFLCEDQLLQIQVRDQT